MKLQSNYTTYIHSKREFEFWIFDLYFMVEYFIDSLPMLVGLRLDYRFESLDVLEEYMLEKYPNNACIYDRYEMTWIEDAARYVGEVFRRQLDGRWNVEYKDSKHEYAQLPIITWEEYQICPRELVTTAIEKRTGNHISNVFKDQSKILLEAGIID